jgi:hypothetical protein
MSKRSRYFATSLIVFLSIGIFAAAGYVQAAQGDEAMMQGQKAMLEGAKQMMDGNKTIMGIMEKKEIKDADLATSQKMMADGYSMITKGQSMMTGSTKAEGQEMVKKGAKMMLDAQKMTNAVVEKHQMVRECSIALDSCTYAEKKINEGALQWFFGGAGAY